MMHVNMISIWCRGYSLSIVIITCVDNHVCVPCTMKVHFICHVVVPELQMCGYGAQQKNAPDPSSYWNLS